MAPKKNARSGKTATFGISVDSETRRFLQDEAERRFKGNVSKLIVAMAREARSRTAATALMQRHGWEPMTEEERTQFISQFEVPNKPRKRTAGATVE